MKLQWLPREQPLQVTGCWAAGKAAQTLRAKLSTRNHKTWKAVTQGDRLVLLGDDLPWVDGAVYLGLQSQLYLPTLWQPNLPLAWIAARLQQLGPPPWALLPPDQAIGLSKAVPLR